MTIITVIIPVYNEEDEILDCLESLGQQTLRDFEIIVVDDGSSDGTLKRLKNVTAITPAIKLLTQNHKGPGAARNLGAKEAKGNILVFVDADMIFDKKFLSALVDPILNGEIKGTFSKEEIVTNWENVWARCWNINEGWPEKRRHPVNYPNKQKVFRAIQKKEFEKAGGFTTGGYTDDYSLYKKLGYLAINAPGAIFYHKNPDNLKEVFRQAKWASKREYKFGYLGMVVALVRAFFFVSVVVGLYKTLKFKEPMFVVFKFVYDLGSFLGILELLLIKKSVK